MNRVVGHIDIDYFYAQVEEVEDPSIKQRPVLVCVFSGRTEDSGVVSTSNYRARELGVHSGMPIALAKKKLQGKDPALIRMDHEKYEVVSSRIMESIAELVDILEPTGIDEAFFDLTSSSGGDFLSAKRTAEEIKDSIYKNERLTCSVGLGRSKVVAKLCSDMAKPRGLKVVLPDETEAFLSPLPVSKLYGVGPKTTAALAEMGMEKVGEMAGADPQDLEAHLGRKLAAYLVAASRGADSEPVVANLEPAQYSRIVTLKHDTRDPAQALGELAPGFEYIHNKLVASGKSFKSIAVIGILSDLTIRTKSKTFEAPVADLAVIRESSSSLFEELSQSVQKDFRRVGVRVSGLSYVEDQRSLSDFIRPSR